MSKENVATARPIYEARNRGDIGSVLAECDPDVTWHPHLREDWQSFRHEPEDCLGYVSYHDRAEALEAAGLSGRAAHADS
jgi:ketosteroid isomerase-like protein